MTVYVGIDNGLTGGIAVLESASMELTLFRMPSTTASKKKDRVDGVGIADLINVQYLKKARFLVEKPSGSKQASSARSMADSFARIETVLELLHIEYQTIRAQDWQPEFWTKPDSLQGEEWDTKIAARLAVEKIWPDQSFLPTPRHSVPHDGLVDAALIAEYARRKGL